MPRYRAETKGVTIAVLKRRKQARKDYAKNKARHRNNMYKYLYGITLDQYTSMLGQQEGVCALCSEPPKDRKGHATALVPDHNHETGEIRALLCHRCNVMLGKIENNRELTQKMFDYLDKQNL